MPDDRKRYDEIPFSDILFPIRILWDKRLSDTRDGSDSSDTWHEQLEILYFIRGGAEVECGFRRFVTADLDIVIINPCEVHSVRYFSGTPQFHCFMIDPKLYNGGENDICGIKYIGPMTKQHLHFNNLIRDNQKIKEILSCMITEIVEARRAYEIAVKGDILRLLAELFRNELRAVYSEEEKLRNLRGYEQLAPALRYISEFYAEPINLRQLSGLCCMNPSYFCRRFKETVGRNAVEYINEYRMAKAEALLNTTGLSVAEIAGLVGFSDSCYFSRRFKSAKGVSPSEIRIKFKYRPDHTEVI